jgi:hypothetical protein
MGVTVAVIVAASLVVGAVLATSYEGVQTTTVVRTDTSTLTLISTVTLTPTPTTVLSTVTATLQSPSTVSPDVTSSMSSTSSASSRSVSCTISGEGGPVYVQLENGSSPVTGVAIDVLHRAPNVGAQSCGTASLPTLYTNSTGWVEIPGDNLPYAGSFLISFVYSASDYNSTVQIQLATTTYVYISLPSGSVTTINCAYGDCPTISDTMGMDS